MTSSQYSQLTYTYRYVDWGLQNQYDKDGEEILPRSNGEEEDERRLAAWREGRTGFP